MKRSAFAKFIFFVMLFIFQPVLAQKARIAEKAPDFTLLDSHGKKHSLSDFKGKFVVLEWINFDCPFVRNHYNSGNMQKLQKAYVEKEVVWLSLCSSAPGKQGHFAAKEINARMKKVGASPSAYLVDETGKVGRMYGAKTTPHMFIINPEGVLIYAGGIDDKPSTKIGDVEDARNYVRLVLDAALAGEEVTVRTSTPYGCSVKYGAK